MLYSPLISLICSLRVKGSGTRFIFRIDELAERSDAPDNKDHEGNWVPIHIQGWNVRKSAGHGISHQWYWHDGDSIRRLAHFTPPTSVSPYRTGSMFYSEGFGFWYLRGGEQHITVQDHSLIVLLLSRRYKSKQWRYLAPAIVRPRTQDIPVGFE
jgi:hypothetical protein